MNEELLRGLYEKYNLSAKGSFDQFKSDMEDPSLQRAIFEKLGLDKKGKFEDFQSDLLGSPTTTPSAERTSTDFESARAADDARRLRENPNVLNTDQRITAPAAPVSDASAKRPAPTASGGSISDMVNTITQNAPRGDINRDVGVPQYNPADVIRPMTDEEFAAEAVDNPMGATAVGALDALSSAPLRWAQGVITGIEDAAKNMMESYAAVKDVTTGGGGRNREIALRTGRDLTEMSNNLKDGVDAMRILTEEERQSIAENAAELNLMDGIGKKDMRAIPILLSQLTGDILVSRGTGTLGPVSYGLQAYGDADRELRNIEKTQGITISDDVKSGYKLGMGSAVGILDRFGAEGIVNKAVLKGLQQKIVTESLKEAAKKGARMSAGEFLEIVTTKSNSVGQLLKSGGVNALKGAGYEGGSELVEQGLTDAIKLVSNREEGQELFNVEEMKKTAVERYVNAFAGGTVGGGLLSGALGFSGTGNYVINEMAKAETKEQADAVIADVLGSIASSGAAPETVEMMRESLEDLAQAAMMLPKATTSEQRLKMLGLIQERREQDDAIKKAEQAVKDADEVFQDDEKLNVERLQARRKFINNEIKETAYGEKYKYTSEDGNYYQQLGNKPKELISQLEYEEMTAYREMEDVWKPIVMDDTVSDAVFEGASEGVTEQEAPTEDIPAETEATVTQTIEPVQEYTEAETGSRIDTPISEMIGQPIVVENHKGDKTGVVALEDGEYVINMSDGVSYLLGTEFGVADVALSDAVPELVVRTEVPVSINEDWTVEARGTTYVNLYSDPLAAINRDEQGGIVSVTLDTQDGKKRTFRGQIAQDIAYQMLLKEFTNNEQEQQEFESFLESERSNDVVAWPTVEQAPRVVEQVQPTTRTEQPTATGTTATTTPRTSPTPRGNATDARIGRNANASGVTSSGEFEKGQIYTRTLSSGKKATYTLQDIVKDEDGTLFMFQRENSPYAIPIKSTDTEFLNSFDGIGVNIQQSEESNVLQTIIKEGINEADKFRKGQVVYDRFTPQEQRGISEGGEHHVNATTILSANARANTEESAPNEEQEALLEQYARDKGIWMEDTNAILTEQYGETVGSGEESVIYPDGTSVIKSQNTNLYDDLQAKVDSITLHNSLFAPETGLEVIGFGRNADGDFQVVVRQPYIQGTRPTRGELDGHVESLGFKKVLNEANEYRTSDTIIDDLHLGNAIKTPAGNIAIIDPVMRLNTPAQGVGGKRTDTNNISVPNPSRNVTEATTVTTTLPNGKEPRTFIKTNDGWYVAKKDGTPSKTKVGGANIEFLNNKINNNEQTTETTDEGVRMRETEAQAETLETTEDTPAEETPAPTKKEATTETEKDAAKARKTAAKAKLQGALKGDTDARASLDIDLSDLSGVAALRSNSEAMAALQELVESGVELGKYNIGDFLADLEDVGISVKRIYAADILQQLKENIGATTSQTDAAFFINPTGEPALAALIDKYAQERDGYKTRARKALRHIYALESAADKYTDDEMYDVLQAKYPYLIEGLTKNDFRVVASQPLQPATEQGTVFTFDGNDYMYDGQVWRTLDGKRVGSNIDISFYSAMFGTAEAVENDALKIMVLTKGNTLNDILAAAPDLATIIPKKQLAELYKRVSAMSKEQRALQFNYAIPSAGTINVNNREYVIGNKGDITAKDGKPVSAAEKSAVIRESLVDQVEKYDRMQMNRRMELNLGRSIVTSSEAAPPLDINNYVPTTPKQKAFVESVKDVTEQMSRTGIHVSQVVHKSTAEFNSFVIGAGMSRFVGAKAIIIFRKGKGIEIHYNADTADATTPYHENAHAVLYTLFERTGYTTEQVEVVMDTLSVEMAKAFKGNEKNSSIIEGIIKWSQNPVYQADKTDTLEFTTEMLGRLLKGDIVVNRGFWAAEAGKAVWRGMKKVFHKLFSAMGMNTFADKVFGEKFSISNANDVGRLFNSIARAMKGETSAIDLTKSQFDGKYVKFNNKPSTFVIEEDNARAQAGDSALKDVESTAKALGNTANNNPDVYSKIEEQVGVLYHGTEADFDKFDRVGQKIPALGLGYYFTPTLEKAKQYGSKIKKIVLEDAKTLNWNKLSDTERDQIKKRLEERMPKSVLGGLGKRNEKTFNLKTQREESLDFFHKKQEETSNYEYERGKARVKRDGDNVVISWSEEGLGGVNDTELLGFAQQYDNNIGSAMGYDAVKYGNEIAVFNGEKIKNATNEVIAEAYHKAKKDGSNPTLVALVEETLDQQPKFQKDKLLAPNGKPSNLTPEQYAQVRTPEFKSWFGDWENDAANASKVLDANGEPLVVYHGTNATFDEFVKSKQQEESDFGVKGFYFGEEGGFFDGSNRTIKAFLNIKNPATYRDQQSPRPKTEEQLIEQGFDGFIPRKIKGVDRNDIMSLKEGESIKKGNKKIVKISTEGYGDSFELYEDGEWQTEVDLDSALTYFEDGLFVAFEPNQIKSATGNSGEFNATNPNIYAQLDENATPDDIAFVDMTEADKKIYDDVKDIIKTFGNEYTALNIVNTINSYASSTNIDPRVIYKAYTDAKREAMDKAEATENEQGTGGLLTTQGVADYINEPRSIVTRKSRQQTMAEAIAKGYTSFESLRPIINRNRTNKAGYNKFAINDVEQAGAIMVLAKNEAELHDLYDQRLKGAGASSSYVENRIAFLTDQNQSLFEILKDGASVAGRVLAYRARRFTVDTFDANAILNMLQQHRNNIEAANPGVVMPKINNATRKKIEDIAKKGGDFAKALLYAEQQVDKQVIERWKEHAKSGIENISEGSADKGAAQMADVEVKNRDVQLTRAIFVAATKYIDGYAADITKNGEKKINPATEKALEAAKEVKMPDGTTLYDMMMAKGKPLQGESKEVGAIRWLRGLNDAVISKATTNQAMYNIAKKNKTEILGYVTPTPVQVTNAVNTALKEEFDVITINQALARASSLSIKNERDRLIQDKTNLALQNKSIRRFNTVLKQLEEDIADGAAYTDANLTALKESINTALTSMLDGVENANFPPKTMTAVQNYISDIMNAFTASAVRGNMVVTDAVGLSKAMYGIMAELEAGKMDSMVAQNAADIRALKNGDLEAISRISVAYNNMPTNSLILQKRAELQHSQQELQKEIQRTKIELNLAAMSSGEKFWYKTKRNLYTAFEGTRTINFMGDISALFIQARMATLGMIGKAPLRLAKLVYDVARSKEIQDDPFQWKALIADPIRMARHAWRTNTYTHAEANYEAMTEHPLHHYREQSGLAITRPGDMYATEEQFASDLFEGKYSKWGVRGVLSRMKKASEVHMSTMLNNARVAMFDSFVEANPEASPEEMRAIAKMINTQTGRTEVKGDTKKGIMKALSFALAAPRLYLSDIKEPFEATALLLGPNTPRSVRRHVAASYFTSAVGYSMIFAAAAFFTALYNAAADDDEEVWIETDADKPGFLQIHVGKVAIAPGSRIGRTMFFMKKLGRVAFDMPSDKVSDRRRQTEQLMDVMFREYKYKIHPFPSAGSRVWFGTDFMGKPLHPNRWVSRALATTAFLPIIGQQVSEPFKDMMVGTEEWNAGEILSSTAVAAPNLLGINSRDFSDNMGLHPESTKKLDIIGKAVYDGYVKKGVPAIAEGKKYAARFYKTDLNNRTAHHIGLLLTDYDREDIESMSQTERDMLWKDIKNTAQNNALAEFQEIWADAIAYFEPEVEE